MIKKYKKGDGFAYYFKAYHGIDMYPESWTHVMN